MYCTGCGSQIDDDARFCTDCGKAVSGTTTNTSSSVTRQPATMTLSAAYGKAFTNYANFDGRTGHSEYWGFAFPQMAVTTILALPFTLPIVGMLTMFYIGDCIVLGTPGSCTDGIWGLYGLLIGLFALNLIVFGTPLLAATIRRLHDIGRSVWWLLLLFVPVALIVAPMIYVLSFIHSSGLGDAGGWAIVIVEILLGTLAKLFFWGGFVWIIIILARKGDPAANRYGPPNPA